MANEQTLGIATIDIHDMEERRYFRKLILRGNQLGLRSFVFTPHNVDEKGKRIYAYMYDSSANKWVREWTAYPALVYDRCRYRAGEAYARFKRFRETQTRLLFLNHPIPHKWGMHQLLSRSERIGPHMPETRVYTDHRELLDSMKRHPLVYVKPINGTGGRGILRVERRSGDRLLVQGRKWDRSIIRPKLVTENRLPSTLAGWELRGRYMVQQGIQNKLPNGRVFDFRLLIQKTGEGEWDVTGCAGRIGPRQSITSNLHGGGQAVPMNTLLGRRFSSEAQIEEIRSKVYDLGYDVAKTIEEHFGSLCELGIDIAVDPDGHPWLLEVNPKPAREVFARIGETTTYEKAISRPLEYALWLHNQHVKKRAESRHKQRAPLSPRVRRKRLPRPT
ncbi:YheC/YheD family protein [Paenibacillus ginsengarvi]|uniref:YheC/YheD family protein n=1 Tax=Paenibacillus ginsengarvi TaxID=400777 RepID=A0A3B0CNP4_9BACL|nr:YheC/YheD family protein [Paenibacillus ginsengarvi]RKN85526.1 YheC/YheD family protein [Paenibacillus ginsengarvi]